jgi:hypothetical protein
MFAPYSKWKEKEKEGELEVRGRRAKSRDRMKELESMILRACLRNVLRVVSISSFYLGKHPASFP